MKTKITPRLKSILQKIGLLLMLPVSLLYLSGCDDKDPDEITPNNAVLKTFKQMYPTIKNESWHLIQSWQVADFEINDFDVEAWYNMSGSWGLTTTDISFFAAPAAVKTGFSEGKYASWLVDDVYKIERVGISTIYVLIVKQMASATSIAMVKELHYTDTGNLIVAFDNQSGDVYYLPRIIPAVLVSDIMTTYPSAQIVDYSFNFTIGEHNIYIHDGTMYKEVIYNDGNQLSSTSWVVSTVPAEVSAAFNSSAYNSYFIDSIQYVVLPGGVVYYRYNLYSSGAKAMLKIEPDGTILL